MKLWESKSGSRNFKKIPLQSKKATLILLNDFWKQETWPGAEPKTCLLA